MAEPIPARRGHKKSASTSALAVMAGPSPPTDHAFRDLTNTRPEERQRSSRSRMTTAPTSAQKETSAGLAYLPGMMSPRRPHREAEQSAQQISSTPSSPSSSRLSRPGHPRKSRLSTYTTSSMSDTLHESTEEDEPPFLRPYTPQQRLAPADIPIPPSPAFRRSATSSTLTSDAMTDETPKSKHRSQRSPRKSTTTPSAGFRRSESMYAMTDTTGSEVDTPKRSSRHRKTELVSESGTPVTRSSRRKSGKSRIMTVPSALETLLSLRTSHASRLGSLTYMERKLAEACPVKLTTEIEPDSPLSVMLSHSLHVPLLSLFGRHFSLMEQTNERSAEEYLAEIEVALNVLQGLCMLELGLAVEDRKCARAMSVAWVFEALVDLLLLLRKSPYRPDLSLKVQLHCISTSFILLLHSDANTRAFIDAGGTRALDLVARDGDDLDHGAEMTKQKKEIKLKCLEVCYFVSLDPSNKERLSMDVSATTSLAASPPPTKERYQSMQQTAAVPQYMTDYMAKDSPRSSGSPRTERPPRSNSALGFRRASPKHSDGSTTTRVVEQSVYLTTMTVTTEGNRSSSNSSSGTALTNTTAESSLLRTPHDSYLTEATSIFPSARGYESERSEKSSHATYLAPFAPSTPKKSSRSGMPKSSSSQGLGYWTPQVKSRVRHDAADLRDDQGLGSSAPLSGLPPRRPSSSAGFRGMLGQVAEEHGSPKSRFGDDLGPLMHSTTRSEAKGSGRAVSSGSELSGLESGMERSLARAKERQERQDGARQAATHTPAIPDELPPRIPTSKSYIGLGMPGRARSSRPPDEVMQQGGRVARAEKQGGSGMLSRMKKSSTAIGLSDYTL